MSEVRVTDAEIAKLQDIAHNILNFTLNYSSFLRFPFLNRFGDRTVSDKIILEFKNALKLLQSNRYFLKFFDLFHKSTESGDINDSLMHFFLGLSDLIKWRKEQEDVTPKEISLTDMPPFIPDELKFANPENKCLENITTLFKKNSDLFKIAFINGSLGSNDYVPGWSDVDIFAVISNNALNYNDNFCRLKSVAREIKKEIFSYNRLQVHPVFYSLESDFSFYRYNYFPIACLNRGKCLASHEESFFLYESKFIQREDANKIYYEAYHYFKWLMGRKNKSTLTKVLLVHRLFLFPVFYLAMKGITCYKADSFDLLPKYLKNTSHIVAFCESLKDIYRDMAIQYSHAFRLRRFFMSVADPQFVNNISLRLGGKQSASIARLFDLISRQGIFEEVEHYWSLGLTELKDEDFVI